VLLSGMQFLMRRNPDCYSLTFLYAFLMIFILVGLQVYRNIHTIILLIVLRCKQTIVAAPDDIKLKTKYDPASSIAVTPL